MTRARTASFGVAILTAIQPLLGAVLMLCVSLVQGAATMLRMIFNRRPRDWHTETANEDLPQATSGISLQELTHTHGVMLGLVPGISVGAPQGLANHPLEAINRDARHKAERDSVDVARTTTILSFRAKAHSAADPEPRVDTLGRRRARLLGSGSHAARASGMTTLTCDTSAPA